MPTTAEPKPEAPTTPEPKPAAPAKPTPGKKTTLAPKSRTSAPPTSGKPTLFSPEGILMLALALIADIIMPLIVLPLDLLFGIGEIINFFTNIFFTLTLGTWMYLRGGGQLQGGKKLTRFLKRRGPLILVEYIPLIGSLMPTWTINTILFLRERPDE